MGILDGVGKQAENVIKETIEKPVELIKSQILEIMKPAVNKVAMPMPNVNNKGHAAYEKGKHDGLKNLPHQYADVNMDNIGNYSDESCQIFTNYQRGFSDGAYQRNLTILQHTTIVKSGATLGIGGLAYLATRKEKIDWRLLVGGGLAIGAIWLWK